MGIIGCGGHCIFDFVTECGMWLRAKGTVLPHLMGSCLGDAWHILSIATQGLIQDFKRGGSFFLFFYLLKIKKNTPIVGNHTLYELLGKKREEGKKT